ncbi:hypothetical protein ACS0TY_017945 [Phlomoides rotata]
MPLMDSENEELQLCAIRVYVLYTFGCTVFADKNDTRISSLWLEYLDDMNGLDEYAWGTTILTFIYRQLRQTSRFKVKQILGYMTLLEIWIYEHFPSLVRPPHNVNFVVGNPLSSR